MNETKVQTVEREQERLIGRHKARLLTNLEDGRCPMIFIQAVKAELQWLRDDLAAALATLKDAPHDPPER